MNAELAFDPKLDCLDVESKASPVGRPRHLDGDLGGLRRARSAVGNTEALRGRGDALAQVGYAMRRAHFAGSPTPRFGFATGGCRK